MKIDCKKIAKAMYKYFWLIRIIIRNFDGTKTHYPTQSFIRESDMKSDELLIRILDWQTDNKFKNYFN